MTRPDLSNRNLLAGVALSAMLAVAPVAGAQATAGDAATQAAGPHATLSAQASAEVTQDTVQVVLAAEVADASQAKVSDQLNARLDSVMKQARGHAGIEVRSGSYRIWPMNDRDGQISEWRGHAEILLRSRDFVAASRLAAQLADRMPINGLTFSVSHERQAEEERKLLDQAVTAFKARAQALTQALGFAAYRLHSIDLGGAGDVPPSPGPRLMRAMAADSVAAPIEGGRQTISVSIQGTIVLLPTQTATRQ